MALADYTPTSLSLILPCYNPPAGWASNVSEKLQSFQKQCKSIDTNLILVNDGSNKVIREEDLVLLRDFSPNMQYIYYPENKGKGYALRQGVAAVETELILLTDIDFPYTIESMLAIEDALLKGAEVAVGVRDEAYYKSVPPFRRTLSKAFRKSIQTFLKLSVDDTQCGLKGFRKSVNATFVATTINRFLFDLEFLVLCKENNKKVQGVPVRLRQGIQFSTMGVKVLMSESTNLLKIILRTYL